LRHRTGASIETSDVTALPRAAFVPSGVTTDNSASAKMKSFCLGASLVAVTRMYRALPSFRGESAFYTWLYRIAINTAKNALVSNRRRPVDFDLDLQDPEQYERQARLKEGDTPEGLLLTEEIRQTVQAAMAELPEDLRTAIMLRELEGLSYEEIAERMSCPVGTVRSRIFRAREAIDKKLKPLLDE